MNNHTNDTPSLRRLALLAQQRPTLLAGLLALYKEQERLSDEQLAVLLHCDTEALPKLALCERPREAPHFREDVERIAAYISADGMQLARVIRAAESRAALQQRSGPSTPTLLAARDREDDDRGDEDTLDT